jgi:hypothetical protein
VVDAFATPEGGWPVDEPLTATCKRDGKHEPHEPADCGVEGCQHDGRIPDPGCRCGIYATRSLEVVSDYLRTAAEPVLGIVELGGRAIMAEPDHLGYARAEYAAVKAILLIDRSLTVDHATLRRLAEAYNVPALVPHSADPDDYRSLIQVTAAVQSAETEDYAATGDEAEEFLKRLTEGGEDGEAPKGPAAAGAPRMPGSTGWRNTTP